MGNHLRILLLLSFFSLSPWAETYKYKLDGMTCAACKNMVKLAICPIPGIKSCDIQVGSMKLSSEEGKELDQSAINKALAELNKKNSSEYKISSSKKVKE